MVAFLKKLVFKGYVIILMVFTVWYGYFMYPLIFGFEGKEAAEISLKAIGEAGTAEEKIFVNLIAEQSSKTTTDLGYKTIEQPYIEGRFHHIGFEIQKDNSSTCIVCHGNVPHKKSKEIRSFLNMHTFYLACETCHAVSQKNERWAFRWYDKDTGNVINNPFAMTKIENNIRYDKDNKTFPIYGDYGAKIAPMKEKNGQLVLFSGENEMNFIKRYITERKKLMPEQTSQMKKIIHKTITDETVKCENCHRENQPYIQFSELGYPELRSKELSNLAVIGMLKKYHQFYIPDLFKESE